MISTPCRTHVPPSPCGRSIRCRRAWCPTPRTRTGSWSRVGWDSFTGSKHLWQREPEGAAPARFGFDPDAAAVAVHHLLADRQADAGARVLALVVQALEHHEDALEVLHLDADAVVAHGDLELAFFFKTGNFDPRLRLAAELEGVAHQALH